MIKQDLYRETADALRREKAFLDATAAERDEARAKEDEVRKLSAELTKAGLAADDLAAALDLCADALDEGKDLTHDELVKRVVGEPVKDEPVDPFAEAAALPIP